MQLDLLTWQQPVVVIPFPASKRIGHIRRTADRVYNSRTNREAEDFWRRALDGLFRQMRKAGVAENLIEAELRAFADSVRAEMIGMAARPYRPGGDAA